MKILTWLNCCTAACTGTNWMRNGIYLYNKFGNMHNMFFSDLAELDQLISYLYFDFLSLLTPC